MVTTPTLCRACRQPMTEFTQPALASHPPVTLAHCENTDCAMCHHTLSLQTHREVDLSKYGATEYEPEICGNCGRPIEDSIGSHWIRVAPDQWRCIPERRYDRD